jgi:peptide/nickel transport system permease protein
MKLRQNSTLWIGVSMLAILVIVMFFGQYFPKVDTTLEPVKHRWNEENRLLLPAYAPSEVNPLGSNKAGVDNYSKLIMGTKETIFIILSIGIVRYLIAIPLGLLSYRNKGSFYFITSSLNQVFSYLPTIFSAMILVSLPFILMTEFRIYWIILILAFLEVGRVAYIIGQQTNKISKEQYVEAGVALGLSPWRIAKSYYMPTLGPELIINFFIDLGKITLLIGQLGILSIYLSHAWVEVDYFTMRFLNTSNNWINILADHRSDIYLSKFAFVFFPALAIMYTILTFNILGEGLRKHFNRRVATKLL